jgi:drug/metabolite transporter (DMT)-like permease
MNDPIRMGWGTALLLAATLLLLSLGQILFKLASKGISFGDPRSLLSPSLLSGLFVYGLATIMWILVLKRLPLSLAFPFYGLTFLLVPLLAHFLIGEKIGYQTLLGGGIIMFGVFVTSWGKIA